VRLAFSRGDKPHKSRPARNPDYLPGDSRATTAADPKIQRTTFRGGPSIGDQVATTECRYEADIGGPRCASCSIREVALGAIVASHIYKEAQHDCADSDD